MAYIPAEGASLSLQRFKLIAPSAQNGMADRTKQSDVTRPGDPIASSEGLRQRYGSDCWRVLAASKAIGTVSKPPLILAG